MMRRLQLLLGRSDIWFNGSRYMRRWLVGPKWFFGLRVHCIERSDADRELHDHPFDFVSFIVSGGYQEILPCSICGGNQGRCAKQRRIRHPRFAIVRRRAEDLHRIELNTVCPPNALGPCVKGIDGVCAEVPAWTIVLRGPYRRKWGFMTSTGWQPWERFTRERDGRGTAAGEFAAKSSL